MSCQDCLFAKYFLDLEPKMPTTWKSQWIQEYFLKSLLSLVKDAENEPIARYITLKQYHSISAEEHRRTLTVTHRCLYKPSKEAFTSPTCPPRSEAKCELGLSSPPSNEVMSTSPWCRGDCVGE